MPSIKKKVKREAAKARPPSHSRAASRKSASKVPQPNQKYLEELLTESKLLMHLQQKELSEKKMSSQEDRVLAALRLKRNTIEKDTRELEEANIVLTAASRQREEVRAICKAKAATSPTTKQLETTLLRVVERDYRSALSHAKNKLLGLLEQDWVVHTLVAIGSAGAIGWLGHRTFVSAADATTELLREANQMAQTIEATRELIQTTSHEGAKWTFSALGGAVGAANGLLLGTLLPGPAGTISASALTSAALGMYAGWRNFV